jgi:ketosteroid isomerase-like protein
MKKLKLMAIVLSLFTAFNSNAQKAEVEVIKKIVTNFSKAGDTNNSEKLSTYLDDNYRIVMNRLFGSTAVSTMSKSMYLEKIASKEFGGDERKVSFDSVTINGNTACAIVMLEGEKMTSKSIITLVKNTDGIWKLMSDMPVIG